MTRKTSSAIGPAAGTTATTDMDTGTDAVPRTVIGRHTDIVHGDVATSPGPE